MKKITLAHNFYLILRSYLLNRYLLVTHEVAYREIHSIQSGVPQGSVLGPVLRPLFATEQPANELSTVATFAYDTAVLASNINTQKASNNLQIHLNKVQQSLKKNRK